MSSFRFLRIFLIILCATLVSSMLLISDRSISSSAAIICDTANGFSNNSGRCTKTETTPKLCNPNRNYPTNAFNSPTPELNNGTCTVQKKGTVITQDYATNSEYQYSIDTFNSAGTNYLVTNSSTSNKVYQLNPTLTTFNTTPVQTFTAPAVAGVTNSQYYKTDVYTINNEIYYSGVRSTFTSNTYRVDNYKWVNNQFVYANSFTTYSYGYSMDTTEINGVYYMGIGSLLYKFDTATQNWIYQIGQNDNGNGIDGTFGKFGNDYFYIATGYGSGQTPKAYKLDTTNNTWSLNFNFPLPVVSSGTPSRVFYGDYTGRTSGFITTGINYPYPQSQYVNFSADAQNAWTWNGTTFVSTPSARFYSPYAYFSLQAYQPITHVPFKDYDFWIGAQTNSRICTITMNSHQTTGSDCARYPNGANQSNISDGPVDNAIITTNNQIYVYSVYAFSSKAGIVASTRLYDETYTPIICPSSYTSSSSTECSRTITQSSEVFYEIEPNDLRSATCTPDQLKRNQVSTCMFEVEIDTSATIRLPENTTARFNSATGISNQCEYLNNIITCSGVPTNSGSFGIQSVYLSIPSFEDIEFEQEITILSDPTISSISPSELLPVANQRIVLTGTQFHNPTSITIGGVPCTDIQQISETEVNCVTSTLTPGQQNIELTNSDNQKATYDITILDDDNDIVPKEEEVQAGNEGDGNNDGEQDYLQPTVASIPLDESTTITTDFQEGCAETEVVGSVETASLISDNEYSLSSNLIEYEINCPTNEVATLKQYWYGLDTTKEYVYRKFGPTTPGDETTEKWYTYEDAVITKETIDDEDVVVVSLNLQDGVFGDDTEVDNKIMDPGGLAILKPIELNNTSDNIQSLSNTKPKLLRTGGK
jgi:IPT/TIG domain